MDYLWSPWRMEYIEHHGPTPQCVFCSVIEQEDGPDNLVVFRGENAFVILNRFPYTSGHLMVVPYQHHSSLEELDRNTRAEMMELVTRAVTVLRQAYNAPAFNLGANIGEAAGAGIADHVHLHIVPRWVGDTNFMTSLGKTRVLPETLQDSYEKIRAGWGIVGRGE